MVGEMAKPLFALLQILSELRRAIVNVGMLGRERIEKPEQQ